MVLPGMDYGTQFCDHIITLTPSPVMMQSDRAAAWRVRWQVMHRAVQPQEIPEQAEDVQVLKPSGEQESVHMHAGCKTLGCAAILLPRALATAAQAPHKGLSQLDHVFDLRRIFCRATY